MTRMTCFALAASLVMAVPALAEASRVTLRKNTVIPVVFEDSLSLKNNRRGDTFWARVDNDRDLPRGTRLVGRITDIQPKRGDRPAYMDLEFNGLVLPSGARVAMRGFPVSMDSRYVRRGRDGRFEATGELVRRDQTVIGTTVGGLLLGSILKKPFEGAFIGALAGIVLAETQNSNAGGVAVQRGARVGALLDRDLTFTWDARQAPGDDRWDDRRNDRWDDRRDDRWDDRRDDRRNDRWDDRWDDRNDGGWNDRIEIAFRNRALRFNRNEEPYRIGNTVMVPLEATARQVNLSVDLLRGSRAILLEDREVLVRLEQDSREYSLNGRRGNLSRPVTVRNQIVYVPLELFSMVRPNSMTMNGARVDNRVF
jgi:hypothetical protein